MSAFGGKADLAKRPTPKRDAMAAWRKFVSCVGMLPADQAAPLWQAAAAEAARLYIQRHLIAPGRTSCLSTRPVGDQFAIHGNAGPKSWSVH